MTVNNILNGTTLVLSSVTLTSFVQVGADIGCSILAFLCAQGKNNKFQSFFIINSVAFFILAFGDMYYDYTFRIMHDNIKNSLNLAVTLPIFVFQLSQAYNWFSLIRQQKTIILATSNLPYLLFTIIIIGVLVYYFLTGKDISPLTTWYQTANVSLDMLIWLFTIICLARTTSISILLLTLGCLMLISSDLTIRSLFMFDMDKVASVAWVHIIWTIGVLMMLLGFAFYLVEKKVVFCHPNSIQANCISWISTTSFIAFITGFLFLSFFKLNTDSIDMHSILWNLPIALMFTMITSVLLGNWFSKIILTPVGYFLKRIDDFNQGKNITNKDDSSTNIYEFKILGEFIDTSFRKLSTQLDDEIKLSTQVAHDIRSPLLSLEVLIKRLPEVAEHYRILLRDALKNIRDIANNLEKDVSPYKNKEDRTITQVAVLLDYLLSERRVVLAYQSVKIKDNFQADAYNYFVDVIPSMMRRILSNIINNAYEAISSTNGIIEVKLACVDSNVCIIISDNGSGITKESLQSLFTRGFTTKKTGSGLGLYYAKEHLTAWNGEINVHSELDKGTIVTIKLPSKNPPNWFVSSLSFYSTDIIICVDDNSAIWSGWQEKFKAVDQSIDLRYCNSKESLQNEIEKTSSLSCCYLIDYEFSGKNYTGLNLINIILATNNSANRIFLVTSRSNEEKIQKFCHEKNIRIIPKFFVSHIPLRILHPQSQNVFLLNDQNSLEN